MFQKYFRQKNWRSWIKTLLNYAKIGALKIVFEKSANFSHKIGKNRWKHGS
jgi:hypothetical protein